MNTNYKIIKFKFNQSIYCANGILTDMPLALSSIKIVNEILKICKSKELENGIFTGKVSISDCQPYYNDILLVLKPLFSIKNVASQDTVHRKKIKIIDFVPLQEINKYYNGILDLDFAKKLCDNIGVLEILKDRSNYKFNSNSGLYIIVKYADEKVYKNLYRTLTECVYNIFEISGVTITDRELTLNEEIPFLGGSRCVLLNTVIPDLKTLKYIDKDDAYNFRKNKCGIEGRYVFTSGSSFKNTFQKEKNVISSSPLFVFVD